MENKCDRIIIFEYLGYFIFFLMVLGFWKNNSIRYFSINPAIERSSSFKLYCQKGEILKIDLEEVDFNRFVQLDNDVLDDIDNIYFNDFLHNHTIDLMKNFLESADIDLAFKKLIAMKTLDIYQKNFLLTTIAEKNGKQNILFFPDQSHDILSSSPTIRKKFKDLNNIRTTEIITNTYKRISSTFLFLGYYTILLFLPIWILYKVGIPSWKKEHQKVIQNCLKIKEGDWAFDNEDRSIDFLLDGKIISRDNTCFCITTEISKHYKTQLNERQYLSIEVKSQLRGIYIEFIYKKIFLKFIPIWLRCLGKALTQPWFMTRFNLEIFQRYLLWSAFYEKYKIKNYIVYDEYVPADTVTSILMTHNNVTTWFYIHSISTFDVFTPRENRKYREVLFSFFLYDHLVVWGNNLKRYYQDHPNKIRNIETVGCLWSEPIKDRIIAKRASIILKEANAKFTLNDQPSPKKIISVFDTSFGKKFGVACFLSSEHMIQFIEDILHLLEEKSEIAVIFKNKKPLEIIDSIDLKVLPSYNRLKAHPRCFFTENRQVSPSEIIAASDLVVAACFTTPVVEALGAGKKGFFFDASNLFKGSYYDKFPNLVAHGYPDLIKNVHNWLEEISDAEFKEFLENTIKEELDSYVDGKAIKRFRDLLADNNY